jgi:hypothetical protein
VLAQTPLVVQQLHCPPPHIVTISMFALDSRTKERRRRTSTRGVLVEGRDLECIPRPCAATMYGSWSGMQ